MNALTRKRTGTFRQLQSSVQGHPVGAELLQKTSVSSEGRQDTASEAPASIPLSSLSGLQLSCHYELGPVPGKSKTQLDLKGPVVSLAHWISLELRSAFWGS